MGSHTPLHDVVGPDERLLMLVGNFGSGKTEVAVNLAIALARAGRRVQLADLDIVNPYFRSREARRLMETHGIRVVVPPGDQAFADLPIVLPEIQGMLRPPAGTISLFDVGGDDVGARALASLRPQVPDDAYALWQVVNSKRPFTRDLEGCLAIQREIEAASRLRVTGLLANPHLMELTTAQTVVEGWRLAQEAAEASGRPLRGVAVLEGLADDPALGGIDVPLLRMRRIMLPPWRARAGGEEASDAPRPAGRPIPIGRPEAHPHPRLPRRRAWDES